VHGENDGLPGLVLDRYGDVFVVKLYSEAWLAHLDDVVTAIAEVWAPEALVLRLSRAITGAAGAAGLHEGAVLIGAAPAAPVPFLENGLRFEADVVHGQKTGFFLDQRDNRARVRRWGEAHRGARVLDVFCCSGGFSVNAAGGGAAVVHSVDIAAAAVASARHNMALNRDRPAVRAARHETTTGDAMEVMARLAGRGAHFDLVVVDPPSFASRKSQVEGALRAYGRLTTLALALLLPGGTLAQFSCSSRVTAEQFAATVHRAASTAGVHLVDERHHGHGLDHPIGFPQGAYLKALFAEARSA
jgi:23S rRNA (cytosine1962-C5)-methyltransferase